MLVGGVVLPHHQHTVNDGVVGYHATISKNNGGVLRDAHATIYLMYHVVWQLKSLVRIPVAAGKRLGTRTY
jgi:hypothetical protein